MSKTEIATIDALASNKLADPMRRTRARLVQLTLIQAAEAGDDGDGYIYLRKAASLAAPLLRTK